jgi:hypothetical protein
MKLSDAFKTIVNKQQPVTPVVEVAAPLMRYSNKPLNHHRGIMHVMGIDPNSAEYEETSGDLEQLSKTNPSLYHKIINMD